MAEVMMRTPDPKEEEERRARMDKRQAEAKTDAFRMQAMTLAVQWCSGSNWSGSSAGVVAAAQVFEHYLTTGQPMGEATYAGIYEAQRIATAATRV